MSIFSIKFLYTAKKEIIWDFRILTIQLQTLKSSMINDFLKLLQFIYFILSFIITIIIYLLIVYYFFFFVSVCLTFGGLFFKYFKTLERYQLLILAFFSYYLRSYFDYLRILFLFYFKCWTFSIFPGFYLLNRLIYLSSTYALFLD